MQKYKAVIFDLDGTLLDTLDDLADAVNHVLLEYGYPPRDKKQIERFLGNGIARLTELALPEQVSPERYTQIFATFKKYYTEHCQVKTQAYPGILALLAQLQAQGYKLAIVSNKNAAAVAELAELYFKKYITVAIGERPGIRKKPAPDTVLQALQELGCTKEETVYVGDSEVDKATADNVGMDCILVQWGFRELAELQALRPAYLVSKPEEILACVTEK